MSRHIEEDTILTIDSVPSEELTALAFTIMNRTIEEPKLAEQLEPYEWFVMLVNNDKRETGLASQTFNPPPLVGMDREFWATARSMMLQFRHIAAVAKVRPELHQMAIQFTAELLEILTKGLPR